MQAGRRLPTALPLVTILVDKMASSGRRSKRNSLSPVDVGGGRTSRRRSSGQAKAQRPARPREELAARAASGSWLMAALLVGTSVWAFWPTLQGLWHAWETEPDYSHGFFVPILAAMFVYFRKDLFPGFSKTPHWEGLVLVVASVGLRYLGAVTYVDSLDGWAIPLWVGGIVWALFGRAVLWWALPSVLFLFFAIPLPYRLAHGLSTPLQSLATRTSCWTLQLLGRPALANGNIIQLGSQQLEVAQACSGLRIFMGIVAISVATIILFRRPWWERLLILGASLPVAILANTTRIVLTGLLIEGRTDHDWVDWVHTLAGWAMIPTALVLFALVLGYLQLLFRPVQGRQHAGGRPPLPV